MINYAYQPLTRPARPRRRPRRILRRLLAAAQALVEVGMILAFLWLAYVAALVEAVGR